MYQNVHLASALLVFLDQKKNLSFCIFTNKTQIILEFEKNLSS